MRTKTKYFYEDKEIATKGSVVSMSADMFTSLFPGVQGYNDGCGRYLVAWMRDDNGQINNPVTSERGQFKTDKDFWFYKHCWPVQRVIRYKKVPSLHICNDRCLHGKCNGVCECQCGGANHGLGNVLNLAKP